MRMGGKGCRVTPGVGVLVLSKGCGLFSVVGRGWPGGQGLSLFGRRKYIDYSPSPAGGGGVGERAVVVLLALNGECGVAGRESPGSELLFLLGQEK